MAKHLLLTGCTGLLGQYLLRDLLLEGIPLAVLIRSRKDEPASERLEQVIGYWEAELGRPLARPICLEGDITITGLGLTRQAQMWLRRHVGAVLHNAASLAFFGKDRAQDPWLSNLTGTSRVLEVCRQAELGEMHYVSTAYVCGERSGVIREDELDLGQQFRNDYENCKFEAEKLVRATNFLDRVTVYRPAIIVGDSRTGYTTTYHGLYSYLYFAWMCASAMRRDPNLWSNQRVRLNLTGDERRNLVPVDWVSAVTTHVMTHPELHGRTYQLTPVQPVTSREILTAVQRAFNLHGLEFAGRDALRNGDLRDIEKMFYEFVARYQPYWSEEPHFDCRHTRLAAAHLPCPPIAGTCLQRLLDFAINDQWGKPHKKKTRKAPPGVDVLNSPVHQTAT
jgi:thioester reductase-like protein